MMGTPSLAIGGGPGAFSTPSATGGSKGVTFSRVVTIADSSFANITVSFPRSTFPLSLLATITAGAGVIQVQGNGVESYAVPVTVNVPANLSLAGFPNTGYVVVQVEQFAASTLAGVVFYT
jgi:hypothetical protein